MNKIGKSDCWTKHKGSILACVVFVFTLFATSAAADSEWKVYCGTNGTLNVGSVGVVTLSVVGMNTSSNTVRISCLFSNVSSSAILVENMCLVPGYTLTWPVKGMDTTLHAHELRVPVGMTEEIDENSSFRFLLDFQLPTDSGGRDLRDWQSTSWCLKTSIEFTVYTETGERKKKTVIFFIDHKKPEESDSPVVPEDGKQ